MSYQLYIPVFIVTPNKSPTNCTESVHNDLSNWEILVGEVGRGKEYGKGNYISVYVKLLKIPKAINLKQTTDRCTVLII